MIECNKEVIKDFIIEADPSIKRESIEFTKIYDVGDGVWLEKYIVVEYKRV